MTNLQNTSTQERIKLAQALYTLDLRKKKRPIDFFTPLEYQSPFFNSESRNRAIFGGNRSGKTISGAAYVINSALARPNSRIRCSTWADMSIPIQQTKIYELLPKDSSVKYAMFSDKRGFANKIIIFTNGSAIRFKTYEQGRESYQGADLDIEWDDEEPPEDIINEQKARLIDRNGILIRTLTPLNGITYTYDEIVLNEKNDPEIKYWYYESSDNTFINQTALERVIGSYASREAEVRMTGHFMNLTSGQAYYPFSDENIIEYFDYMPNRPLEISCDFNVDIMSWNISQEHQAKDWIFDYVELEGQANTEFLCSELKRKYVNHTGGWIFYGDIAGNQRHPETSRTNWTIIRDNFPSAQIYYQSIKNIKDRVDSTNARLKNSKGEINLFITKNCKRLIKDLRQVTWEHLLNKNKAGKLTHSSDGLSYLLHWKYPMIGRPEGRQYNLR